jgi:CheY-like chemotaxis protein
MRVLIADDKEDNRNFLLQLLGATGFKPKAVEDGPAALKAFADWRPQVVLMDLRMPGMDGYEVIKRLRAMENGGEARIIAVSASAFTEVQREARSCGADEFIAKPFREGELFEKIGKLTGAQYDYEDQRETGPDITGPGQAQALKPEMFAACPTDLLHKIREAAVDCDFDALEALAGQVEAASPEAAVGMRALAQKYDSQGILKALPEPEKEPLK